MRTGRWLAAVLVAMLAVLGTAGSALAASYPSQTPTSSVGASTVTAGHADEYCVTNYAPNSTVTVVGDGHTYTITTNAEGSGCVDVYPGVGCFVYTASGTGINGEPATSSASICGTAGGEQTTSTTTTSSGTLPFTGANVAAVVAAGLLLVVVGGLLTVEGRRRRHSAV